MMEGLDNVWDGSESKPNMGYFTLQASVCHYTEPKRVQLLYSDLFSIEQESTSENEKILDLVHRVIVASGQRGIFVMDRGMDRCQILKDLVENDTSFIIRGDKRHLLCKGKSKSYSDIAKATKLDYVVKSKGRTFKAGVVPVQLVLPNDEATKNQRKKKADLYLVVALEPGRSFVYYLCRFRNTLSDNQMVNMVVRYYGLRWSIEEVHRQIKQDFNWESIQLLKYLSLKNMNALLWIAASFLYNEVSKSIPILIKKHYSRMIYRKSESDKDINMMYRLTALVSEVMSYINIHRILKHVTNKRKPRCDNSGQM
ncbi:MAG: transposase [Candidatus Cloacimonetes bacterium]|nr:transposase [Candidatus Cloacimonadota bacterium]